MDAHILKMVRDVEAAKVPTEQSELLRRCGKDLLARPDLCADLIQEAKTAPLSDGQMSGADRCIESGTDG